MHQLLGPNFRHQGRSDASVCIGEERCMAAGNPSGLLCLYSSCCVSACKEERDKPALAKSPSVTIFCCDGTRTKISPFWSVPMLFHVSYPNTNTPAEVRQSDDARVPKQTNISATRPCKATNLTSSMWNIISRMFQLQDYAKQPLLHLVHKMSFT